MLFDKSTMQGVQSEDNPEDWFCADLNIGLSSKDWLKLLKDSSVFNSTSLTIMKRMLDYGGKASCKQLAAKYGKGVGFYNRGSSSLAKRVFEKTNCNVFRGDTGYTHWYTILYWGKHGGKNGYIWKLRPELEAALNQFDLSKFNLYEDEYKNQKELFNFTTGEGEKELKAINFWWLNANPKLWSFSELEVGDIQDYTLYSETGHKRRIFQNFLDAKEGDIVIGYESYPTRQITAIARISQAQDGECLYFEKVEALENPIDLSVFKNAKELSQMESFINPQGSLFKLTADEYNFLMNLIRKENPIEQEKTFQFYNKQIFLSEVYITPEKYNSLVRMLKTKKNIILQGAPGVGKTFAAKRLAFSIMGEKDHSRIEFVQFHQNYSYEDFVMGYKPDGNGFTLKNGVFYEFCKKAESDPEKEYFFIIDEINRGNMSKIFGELLMLIEKGYRGESMKLAYSEIPFSVPKNLYIIGMMNTADRSLAMIDYALRRRFSFFDMEPGFDSDGFIAYRKNLHNEKLDNLVTELKALNNAIADDKSLGKGFCIGHSYLCDPENCAEANLKNVVDFDILPMLAEYWFDELEIYEKWKTILTNAVQ